MEDTLYLKQLIQGKVFLIGRLVNENNIKYTYNYISHPDGVPIDFKQIQFLPLKFREYSWYGVPEAFDEMLINPERPDLPKYLNLLGMEKYDMWEFLKRTKGRSETNHWFLETDDDGIKVNMIDTF